MHPKGFPYEGKLSPQATDEVGAPSILHPAPHPSAALRSAATFPQGKAWGFPQIQGFPYEGKLSAVRLTDEVDSVT